MPALSERVREVLTSAHIDSTANTVTLTEQLSRKDYLDVNKVLLNLGGWWDRKAKAHVFGDDPSTSMKLALDTGFDPGPPRTVEGYVPTPDHVAAEMVDVHSNIGDLDYGVVLEPSAGDGQMKRPRSKRLA